MRALRNRQDLFQEEGILNLILDAIDKINFITAQGYMVALAGEASGQNWDLISVYLYELLGTELTKSFKFFSRESAVNIVFACCQYCFCLLSIFAAPLHPPAAAIIKGNHTNCSQFAQSHRLNWLFSRLGSQASGEGTGMLDVLHCVLIDSPEALNMMRVGYYYCRFGERRRIAFLYIKSLLLLLLLIRRNTSR